MSMHEWRRLWSIAAIGAAAFAVTGCGGNGDGAVTEPETTETETTETTPDEASFTADLKPLNDSGGSGTVTATPVGDDQVKVSIETSGVVPSAPHAQHFHIGGENQCPSSDAAGDDDIISTADGVPSYGDVQVSLTTEGDTGAEAALAVDRMPTADDEGNVTYERTIDVDESTMEALRNGEVVVVQHGIDTNDNGEYDDSAGDSSLDPSLPLEATAPALCGPLTSEASEDGDEGELTADLSGLNDSGASGTATVTPMGDNQVKVSVETSDVLAGTPHAQHFHIGGRHECPDMDAAGDDDVLSTAEGKPAYGDVQVSLTTKGDTGAKSALAVDRMPTADDEGKVTYERTFEVSSSVMKSIEAGDVVIVQHGIDTNDNGTYDNSAGPSSLDPSLPLEATAPAVCGHLSS